MNEGSYKGLRIISMALLMTVMAAFNPRPFTEEDEVLISLLLTLDTAEKIQVILGRADIKTGKRRKL